MRHYCLVILFLDAVLGLAATVALVVWSRGGLDLGALDALDPRHGPWGDVRPASFVLGLSIAVANVLALGFALILARDRTIRTPIEGGEVAVAVAAVEQSLARTACALPDVRDVHVRVAKRHGETDGLDIRADFTTWEGTPVKEITRRLQDVLKMRAQEIVGAEVNLAFDINLVGIVVKGEKKGETTRRKKDKDRQTYRGPVYPIDGSL